MENVSSLEAITELRVHKNEMVAISSLLFYHFVENIIIKICIMAGVCIL